MNARSNSIQKYLWPAVLPVAADVTLLSSHALSIVIETTSVLFLSYSVRV